MNIRAAREVAIIDDDLAVLDSLRFMLEVAGYPVATYGSALAFLDDAEARPCCLVVDYQMPVMNGLELVAKLHQQRRGAPVLLITAAPSRAMRARAAELEITDLLEKPLAEFELLRFVERCSSRC